MDNSEFRIYYERNLPHYQIPGATIFITFRLVDSLPRSILEQLRNDYQQISWSLQRISNVEERRRRLILEQKQYFHKWDQVLDRSTGNINWLRNPKIAEIIRDSLHFLDGKRYLLSAYCIMPNHVHAVMKPLSDKEGNVFLLSSIMHSIKRYTAREANKILNRTGQFWQRETYDHIIRNNDELQRIILYVINNPVRAGLVERWEDWRWSFSKYPL